MAGQRWTREQTLADLYLKLEHKGRLTPTNPDVGNLAKAIPQNENAIVMLKRNFDSLDPSVPGVGLPKASKLTKDIWAEYERDPERVLAEAHRAYLNLVQ